jgi:hypothetical protein
MKSSKKSYLGIEDNCSLFSSCVINALVVSRGVAVSILVVIVGSLIYLGYYSLQNMIDEENKKGL